MDSLLQFTTQGQKLNKQQINNIDLIPIIKELNDKSVKDCANHLQGVSYCLMKQLANLKMDINQLQSSIISVEEENRQKARRASPTKRVKRPQENNQRPPPNFQDSNLGSYDQPRNVASKESITLQDEDPIQIQQPESEHSNNSNNSNDLFQNRVLQDVKEIENQTIEEIMKNNQNNSDTNSNNFDFNDGLPQYEDVFNQIELEQQNQNVQNADQEKDDTKRKKKKIKQQQYDEEIRVYKENLRQYARENEKMDELNLKMNLLQTQSEFWDGKDAYFALIDKHKEQLEETKLVRKSIIHQSNKKSSGKGFTNQQDTRISQFEMNDDFQQMQPESRIIFNNDHEEMERQRIEIGFKDEKISQGEYFERRMRSGVGKAKGFYDMLVLAKIGQIKLKDNRRNNNFSDIMIEILF